MLAPAHAQTTPPPPNQTPNQTPSQPQAQPSQPDDPAPVTTLKIATRLVAVSAIARNKSGQPVTGLTRDDFLLKQDGKPQPIAYFSQGSDLPLTLALMVDTSGSQRAYIRDEIAAGAVFFRTMMKQPADRAVLIQFDTHVLQLAKLTSNVTTLEHGLAYLSQPHDDMPGAGRGGTLLYDAVCAVAKIELSPQLGRRAMVILTDGGDNGSQSSEKKAIEEAQRSDIMIYSVYYSNGGGDFGVLNDLEQIYAEIANDLRLQYQLGYRPPDSKPGKYHKIQLTARDKTLLIQAREGYFTPNN